MKQFIGFVVGAAVLVALGVYFIANQGPWVTAVYNWAKGQLGISAVILSNLH